MSFVRTVRTHHRVRTEVCTVPYSVYVDVDSIFALNHYSKVNQIASTLKIMYMMPFIYHQVYNDIISDSIILIDDTHHTHTFYDD